MLGNKEDLRYAISRITEISLKVLEGKTRLNDLTIAERMSWASKRETSRDEDRAYSLLGIFGVSMPMFYGEGNKAFLRLQEEIIKRSDDHTIFAWYGVSNKETSMLALSPEAFASSQGIREARPMRRPPYSMTNRGLSITLQLRPWTMDTYLALTDCYFENRPRDNKPLIGIFLRRLSEDDQYARFRGNDKEFFEYSQYHSQSLFRTLSINVR